MIPFAMESHGVVGASARRLLFKLASKVSDISAQAFLQQTYARLSVALQSANAAIMVGGLQRLRMDQLSSDLPMSPGLRSPCLSFQDVVWHVISLRFTPEARR